MIPPPPQGYKLVTNKEIPIVPDGAMFFSYSSHPCYCDKWRESFCIGDKPCDVFQYAIPAPITEPESQAELIATQRRVIEILESNLEKSEARFQARETELEEVIESQRQRLAEIRICFNQINHNLS